MDFRAHKIVVLDSCADVVRAINGLDELLRPPAVEVVARVGRRREPASSNAAAAAGDNDAMDVDPTAASTSADASHPNGQPAEQPVASTSTAASGSSKPAGKAKPPAAVVLVGPELDRALDRGDDVEVSWPFRGPNAWSDWRGIEALWKHTLAASGPFHRASNDSPLLLTHPPTLSLAQQQRLAQTLFERLNFPAVQLVARPVASLFAMNAVSGIVVDIGLERTTISPVIDTACHLPGVIEVPLGAEDLERHLVEILRIQPSVLETLAGPLDEDAVPPPAGLPQDTDSQLLRLSRLLWRTNQLRPLLLGGVALPKEQEEEGVTDIAAALVAGREKALMADKAAKSHKSAARREEDAKKRAADDARKKALAEGEEEADVISIEFEGRTVDITFVRQRAAEPLFEPTLVGKTGVMGLGEAVWTSINTLPPHERLAVWEGVAVVGELARIKTLPQTLLSHLMPFILTDPESTSDAQPKNTRFLRIPKHFPEYIAEGGWTAPFLGASVAGKLGFGESTGRFYTTKVDYNHHGPACFTAAPELS